MALTHYLSAEQARIDDVRVLFSGGGSDELFGGYERYMRAHNLNSDLLSSILKLYEQDLYRDDVVTMNNGIELRLPYLDKAVVSYGLRIPSKYKIADGRNKIIVRDIARDLGIDISLSERKKRAAQYGSRMDQAIEKLAKKKGFKNKNEYLSQFLTLSKPRVATLWSSGKDSAFATYLMKSRNYEIACLVTIKSMNPDSFLYHTSNIHMVELQSEAMHVPLILQESKGEEEHEIKDLVSALSRAKKEHHIEGVVTGAISSQYQRDRIEKACDTLGLKIYSPLWQMRQEEELRQILLHGFSLVLTHVAAEGLDDRWLSKIIKIEDIEKLKLLEKKYGVNIAGEGGEYESLVLDCPLFDKRIELKKVHVERTGKHSARLVIDSASLQDKP